MTETPNDRAREALLIAIEAEAGRPTFSGPPAQTPSDRELQERNTPPRRVLAHLRAGDQSDLAGAIEREPFGALDDAIKSYRTQRAHGDATSALLRALGLLGETGRGSK